MYKYLYGISLLRAFHHHLVVLSVWLKQCWKGHETQNLRHHSTKCLHYNHYSIDNTVIFLDLTWPHSLLCFQHFAESQLSAKVASNDVKIDRVGRLEFHLLKNCNIFTILLWNIIVLYLIKFHTNPLKHTVKQFLSLHITITILLSSSPITDLWWILIRIDWSSQGTSDEYPKHVFVEKKKIFILFHETPPPPPPPPKKKKQKKPRLIWSYWWIPTNNVFVPK